MQISRGKKRIPDFEIFTSVRKGQLIFDGFILSKKPRRTSKAFSKRGLFDEMTLILFIKNSKICWEVDWLTRG